MTLSERDFVAACVAVLPRYRSENAWYRGWAEDDEVVSDAWRLYRSAHANALGFLLLGRGPIRTSTELIANFGATSGSGADGLSPDVLRELEARREALRDRPEPEDVPDVVGEGSILNDRNWSPLLNDAFILGGAHGGHEFHVAEEDADAHFRMLGSSDGREKWLDFLRARPDLLWVDGNPRIFCRELLGLERFGYRPRWVFDQLSFEPPEEPSPDATFEAYLDALVAVGLDRRDRGCVLGGVSEFLFGDRRALARAP